MFMKPNYDYEYHLIPIGLDWSLVVRNRVFISYDFLTNQIITLYNGFRIKDRIELLFKFKKGLMFFNKVLLLLAADLNQATQIKD